MVKDALSPSTLSLSRQTNEEEVRPDQYKRDMTEKYYKIALFSSFSGLW
jgi:hypothetical protein